jgi:hypothetical protein
MSTSLPLRVNKSYLVIALLVLVAMVSGLGNRTAFAQVSTPVASPVAYDAPFDPLLLFEALLQSEFPQEYWPTTTIRAVATPWTTTNETLENTVAAVQIAFEGSESFGIAYAIYANETDAAAGLQRASIETGGVATPAALPAEVDAPGVILDYGSFKVCLIQVNNVLVDGAALDVDSAVALARVGVAYLQQVAEDIPAPAATPVAVSSPFGTVAPEQLRDLLVASEFTGTGVPSYLQNPQVAEWADARDTDLIGTSGAATVSFTGGEGGIAYLIFPNSTAAQVRLVESAAAERAAGNDPVERGDLAYPALILGDESGVSCVLQVDYVVIAGFAPIRDGDVDAATEDAIALALAGAEHVLSLANAS